MNTNPNNEDVDNSNLPLNQTEQCPMKALCFNPRCRSSSRVFFINCRNSQQYEQRDIHRDCIGWYDSFEFLTTGRNSINNCAEINKGNFDFMCNPIDSIICMQNVLKSEIIISKKVSQIYEGIKKNLLEALVKSYDKCMEKIFKIADQSKNAFNIVQKLAGMSWKGWNSQAEAFYHNVASQLGEMSLIGMVKLGESNTLERQVEFMKEQIGKIGDHLWKREQAHSIKVRNDRQKMKDQLNEYSSDSPTYQGQNISTRLQILCSSMKIPFPQFSNINNDFLLVCPKCQFEVISGSQSNSKLKKAVCQTQMLRHLCNEHKDDVLSKYFNLQKATIQLTWDHFIHEINLTDAKKFIIIDRENVNTQTIPESDDIYSLEVISLNGVKCISGKYLVAQSRGKDAADIMIVMVIYQISKLRDVEITLITKDHFGKTLQPIFNEFGIPIYITTKYGLNEETSKMNDNFGSSNYVIAID